MSELQAWTEFLGKFGGALNHIRNLQEEVLLSNERLKGCEERCKLILEAKNMWMDRAISAEEKLSTLHAER